MQFLCHPTLAEPETKASAAIGQKSNTNHTFDFETFGKDAFSVVSDFCKYVISH